MNDYEKLTIQHYLTQQLNQKHKNQNGKDHKYYYWKRIILKALLKELNQ